MSLWRKSIWRNTHLKNYRPVMLYCFFEPQEIAIDYRYGEGIGSKTSNGERLSKKKALEPWVLEQNYAQEIGRDMYVVTSENRE